MSKHKKQIRDYEKKLSLSENEKVKCYTIESIISHKNIKTKPEYLVKWSGYPPSESTWEPLEHLSFAEQLVSDYNNDHKLKLPANLLTLGKRSKKDENGKQVAINGRVYFNSIGMKRENGCLKYIKQTTASMRCHI